MAIDVAPTLTDIHAAAARIDGRALRTPLLQSPFLDAIAGRRVFLKTECLQHTGSFKFRGGWSAISNLSPQDAARGVVAFSSGNHAQGVANAAAQQGIKATILMPADSPAIKIANTKSYGAEVVLFDRATQSREDLAAEFVARTGAVLIPPFDHTDVIAGQATVGLEIAEQAQELGIQKADVLIPCGGGGLTAGVGLAMAETAPGLRTRPVEPTGFDDVARSLATGEHCENSQRTGSICDAIISPTAGDITLPVMRAHCGPGVVVTDDDARRAMRVAFERLHVVIEPGGAVALAAALFYPQEFDGDAVIAIASGGNVDAQLFQSVLSD